MKIGGERNLSVDFCGIRFKNPFIIASAPPAPTGEMIGRAFDAGWAGATTKTLMVDAESVIVNVTPRLASLSFPGPSWAACYLIAWPTGQMSYVSGIPFPGGITWYPAVVLSFIFYVIFAKAFKE